MLAGVNQGGFLPHERCIEGSTVRAGEERSALRPSATRAALPCHGLPLQRRPGAGHQLQVRAVLRAHRLLHAAARPDTPPGESAHQAVCLAS